MQYHRRYMLDFALGMTFFLETVSFVFFARRLAPIK
jgi:hypothetical protein